MCRLLLASSRNATAILIAVLLLSGLPQAAASALSAGAFDVLVTDFLAEDGFETLDAMELEDALLELLPGSESAFLPTGQLEPFAKAVMLMEARGEPLERARYHLTLRLVHVGEEPRGPDVAFLLVSAERFNMGPVVHAELVAELGADAVAPLEEFGTGPSEAWRFVMRPLQGHVAMLEAAARKELTADEVGGAVCLHGPCVSLGSDEWPDTWAAVDTEPFEELVAPFEISEAEGGFLAPAALVVAVGTAAGFDPYLSEVSGPERTVAHLVVDVGLSPGGVNTAVLKQGELQDDSLAAIWHMAVDAGFLESREVYQAFECRRGEERFAPPGSYCP